MLYIKQLFHNLNHTLGHLPLWPAEGHQLAVAAEAMAELHLWPSERHLLAVAELPLWLSEVQLLVVRVEAAADPPETLLTGPTFLVHAQTTRVV